MAGGSIKRNGDKQLTSRRLWASRAAGEALGTAGRGLRKWNHYLLALIHVERGLRNQVPANQHLATLLLARQQGGGSKRISFPGLLAAPSRSPEDMNNCTLVCYFCTRVWRRRNFHFRHIDTSPPVLTLLAVLPAHRKWPLWPAIIHFCSVSSP